MPDTSAKIIAALTAAAEGLLVPSEQDVALALFRWPQRQQLTPARLVAALGRPPATPVETRTLDSFFAPLTRTHTALAPDEQAQAARFAALRDLIVAHLSDPLVYRVGSVEIDLLLLGRLPNGQLVGLRTSVVET